MLIRIAIADLDEQYVERLSKVLETYEEVSLSVYTQPESLDKALAVKKFDVLLIGQDFECTRIPSDRGMVRLMLYDEDQPVGYLGDEMPKILKYQRISTMYQQILGYCADIMGGSATDVLGREQAATIVLYSPAGGAGTTCTALALAYAMARSQYRTLYLNLENIASDECYLPQEEGKGISDILNLLGSSVNFELKIQSLLHEKIKNFYYFNHFTSVSDVEEITAEELSDLIRLLESSGLFDCIVIDLGKLATNKTKAVFELAYRILIVEKADATAKAKLERYLSQAYLLEEYGAKMSRILNQDTGRHFDYETQIARAGVLPYVQNADMTRMIEVMAGNVSNDLIHLMAGGR